MTIQKGNRMMQQTFYNHKSLLKNGKPWFPVMGEFHFSRYPAECWEQEIRKMKAGGVNILSTYVIWIHHEEEEGCFDFSGRRSLRDFLAACKKWQMPVFLRPGPWAHAEARNGGFPDWLVQKGWQLRTDDPRYLEKVKIFWEQIYRQTKDFSDIILGIQMENEYGHAGGLQGEAGNQHIRTLTALAKEIGFRADYWTATGWGGAMIGDLIPVMGGYCDEPWAPFDKPRLPSGNYLFSAERNDGNIACDHRPGLKLSFPAGNYPYLTAELGGGLQVTHHRRPRLSSGDIAAMSLAKLGSGCNLLGYYMYHGGTNPRGRLSTLQETIATGGGSDLPALSYDFQAPIREYGQMTDTLKELKLLAMFVRCFGESLCGMDPVFDPAAASVTGYSEAEQQNTVVSGESPDAADTSRIRAILRRNGSGGYLFINNYQRLRPMQAHRQVTLQAEADGLSICWPAQDIESQTCFFYPFHFPIGETELTWINQTPLTRLGSHTWVFYGTEPLQFAAPAPLRQETILALTRDAAKNCWQIPQLPEGIFVSEAPILETETGAEIILRSDLGAEGQELSVDLLLAGSCLSAGQFLPARTLPGYAQTAGNPGNIRCFRRAFPVPACPARCRWTLQKELSGALIYDLEISYDRPPVFPEEELFLRLDFAGDAAELWLGGQCVADQFFYGDFWEVGLGRFGFPQKLTLKIFPLHSSDRVLLDVKPEFTDGVCCRLNGIQTILERKEEVL